MSQEYNIDPDTAFTGQQLVGELLSARQLDRREADLPPIASQNMLRDFQQCFRLGNGRPYAQTLATMALGASYRESSSLDELGSTCQEARQSLEALRPPTRHQDVSATPASHESSFQSRWEEFEYIIMHDEELDDRVYTELFRQILAADHHYLTSSEGRPGRIDEESKRESVYREYVLGDKLQGSAHLLRLRERLRIIGQQVGATDNQAELNDLKRVYDAVKEAWEKAHFGKSFNNQG